MEILFFLKVLLRRLYIIVPICLLAMAATFLMYKNEPKVYTSSALMATGIINVEEGSAGWVQEYKVMNDFNNLITLMLSRESIQTLSQSLVKRDLASESPYRRSDDIGKYLSPAEIVTLVQFLEAPKTDSLNQRSDEQTLTLRNHTNKIAKALGYDEASLRKSIAIERLKDSDFIRVQFTSDNPQLSAMAANTLCNNFIAEFTRQKNEKSDNSADFYRNLAEQKKNELNAKTESLEKFKLNSQVSNLEQQTKATLEQIRELEMQKQRAKEKIPSYEKTLNSLDGYMAQDQQTVRSTKTNNKRITDLQDQAEHFHIPEDLTCVAHSYEVLAKACQQIVKMNSTLTKVIKVHDFVICSKVILGLGDCGTTLWLEKFKSDHQKVQKQIELGNVPEILMIGETFGCWKHDYTLAQPYNLLERGMVTSNPSAYLFQPYYLKNPYANARHVFQANLVSLAQSEAPLLLGVRVFHIERKGCLHDDWQSPNHDLRLIAYIGSKQMAIYTHEINIIIDKINSLKKIKEISCF